MRARLRILFAGVGLLMALSCSMAPTPAGPTITPFAPGSTAAPTDISTVPPSATAPTLVPVATDVPVVPTAACAGDLAVIVEAGLPAGAYNDVGVLEMVVPPGWDPLWAAFSVGMRPFDPIRSHFLAIYTCDLGTWRELARVNLDDVNPPDMDPVSPDFVAEGSVTQVQIDSSRIWLTIDGGVGAHQKTIVG